MAGTGDREAVKTYKPGSGEAASRQPVSSKVPDCSHTTCAYSSCFNQLCLSLCTQGSHVRHVHMTHAHSTHETYSTCLLHFATVSCMLSRSTHPHREFPLHTVGFPHSFRKVSISLPMGSSYPIIRSLLSIGVSSCPNMDGSPACIPTTGPAKVTDGTAEPWSHKPTLALSPPYFFR